MPILGAFWYFLILFRVYWEFLAFPSYNISLFTSTHGEKSMILNIPDLIIWSIHVQVISLDKSIASSFLTCFQQYMSLMIFSFFHIFPSTTSKFSNNFIATFLSCEYWILSTFFLFALKITAPIFRKFFRYSWNCHILTFVGTISFEIFHS